MNPFPIKKLNITLLLTRLTIFLVFLMWTLDKIYNPGHGMRVFDHFYGVEVTESLVVSLGWAQLAFVLIFGLGLWKKWTYLAILIFHAGSTFSSMPLYFAPFKNLLFFAAWPMLAACLVLFLFREYDVYTAERLLKKEQA